MGILDFSRFAPRWLLVAPLALSLPAARADIPFTLPFQAVVKTAAGAPLTGATSLTVSLYTTESGGTALWSETQTVTPDANGVVAVRLGAVTSLAGVPFDQPYYAGVKVGGDAEMTPRLPLGTAPSAFSALHVPYAGVTGAPSSLPPSGGAGGDLTGSYPSPAIAPNAVTSAKLATDAAALAKVSGGAMASSGGNVGIGTASPLGLLHVVARELNDETTDQAQTGISTYLDVAQHDQSFTAGQSGLMTALFLYSDAGFKGTLSLRAGEGTAGALLLRQPITLAASFNNLPLTPGVPVTAGEKYTWIVDVDSPNGGPSGLGAATGNPYAGGRSGLDADIDYVFLTVVRSWGADVDALFVDNSTGFVGVGTEDPSAKLDVRGDVKLGTDGQYSAVGAENPTRIVAGDISGADLTVNRGTGFTVSRISSRPVGGYHIKFSVPFATAPVVTTAPAAAADGISAAFFNPTKNGVDVLVTTPSQGFRDADFSFIAVGGR